MVKHRHSQGFTLLEVLVVLTIIGMLVGLSTLSNSDRAAEDQTSNLAEQLAVQMNLYREEAVFRNIDLGLASDGYEFLLLNYQQLSLQEVKASADRETLDRLQANPWQPYSSRLLAAPDVPTELAMTFDIEGERVDLSDYLDDAIGPRPVLLFLSSEEYTPFLLTLTHDGDASFEIQVHGDGFNPVWHEVVRYDN